MAISSPTVMNKFALVMFVSLSHPAFAQSDERVTCTGRLIDIQTRATGWPLAVIYDADAGRTCTIDRAGAERDPLKPCNAGKRVLARLADRPEGRDGKPEEQLLQATATDVVGTPNV
jgi:hypothetical protein